MNDAAVDRVPLRDWGLRSVAGRAARRRRAAAAGRDEPRRVPVPLPGHTGLWLDRLLAREWSKGERWPARGDLYRVAVASLDPAAAGARTESAVATYHRVFARFREAVTRPRPGTAIEHVELRAAGRLLLHTAGHETVTEGSLLLHHTYGVPYLPGSALKGAARARLLEVADCESDPARRDELRAWADGLLGFVADNGRGSASENGTPRPRGQAALVDFLDALWIPDSPGAGPLALDIVNPHHPDYYTVRRSEGRTWPADGDSPIPIERLSVTPGTRFLLVTEAPADLAAWLRWLVHEILAPAVAEDGLGAWTSSGYGRLIPSSEPGGGARANAGAGAASERPAASGAAAGSAWQPALVIWSPGNSEVSANLSDGRRAVARRQAADALIDALPEEARHRLVEGKKRRAQLEVTIESEGTRWRLTGLRPPSADGVDAP